MTHRSGGYWLVLASVFLWITSCRAGDHTESAWAGCTPGDAGIRKMLGIPEGKAIDFIRWSMECKGQRFVLNLSYGVGKPNTLGFTADSGMQHISGSYALVEPTQGQPFRKVYRFKPDGASGTFSFVLITADLMHVLDEAGQLMVGNGGWSYELNRRKPLRESELFIRTSGADTSSLRMVFDGRTPCREISAEHPEMNASSSCFKLKWRLILNRDPVTHRPTTFNMRKVVDNQPRDITGVWAEERKDGMLIYTVDADKPGAAISFLVCDARILLFLDKAKRPYLGNELFSYAMNRVKE